MIRTLAYLPAGPAAPAFHRFRSPAGEHVLIVRHSRIFDLPPEAAAVFDSPSPQAEGLAEALGRSTEGEAPLEAVAMPEPQSLSLNVSASCNLSCSYCYAGRGGFGGLQPEPMSWAVARAAIDRLLAVADPSAPITVGFLGGEPFVNRSLIHQAVQYAADAARSRGLDVRFSVTTNGTLLRAQDVDLLRSHPFAVTVSIDGGADLQNAQRPAASGGDSFALLRARTRALLEAPGQARLSARATVTRHRLDLTDRFDSIRALGFPEVGFSPLRTGGDAEGPLRGSDWPEYLDALTGLARRELRRALDGGPIRLTNLAVALKQLHRGASAPYPCGAGAGYFSVSSSGTWYACHRAIGSPTYELGDSRGLDEARRARFLTDRHVHAQAACGTCWARYLCSGGCHQEATARTDSSCGFIRGWLDFCLAAYCELADRHPDYWEAEDRGAGSAAIHTREVSP
ncbi:MAG TPA: radical SAM protein [Candidatus Acidoferrum sp.]|nr:radical SAM protein [Candidatus Acidoferrum sp.]